MDFRQLWSSTSKQALQLWHNKNLILYLFFVAVATLFWFLHSLGKEYVANVEVAVRYYNFPLSKEPQEITEQTLTLNVKAYGFSLMRMQLKSAFYDYKIDVSKLKVHELSRGERLRYDLSISAIRNQFEGQLGSGIVINSVFPEDIDFWVKTMKVKKIPVVPALRVNLKSGYMIAEKPKVVPDSVVVRGVTELVDTLKAIYTEEDVLDNVAASFERKVALKTPNPKVELRKSYTKVVYEIAEYIDEERAVEIHPLNFPDSAIVTLRPKQVKLRYRTYAKAKYKNRKEDFVFVVDYHSINVFSQRLEVQPLNLPEGISKVYMTPRYVNYMITYRK